MSTKEKNFEDAIERALLDRGYAKGDPATFDREHALFVAAAQLAGCIQMQFRCGDMQDGRQAQTAPSTNRRR